MAPIIVQMPYGPELWERICRKPAGKALIFNTKHLVSNLAAVTKQAYGGRCEAERLARLPILLGQFARAYNQLREINTYDESRNVTTRRIDPDRECGYLFFLIMCLPRMILEATCFHLPTFTPDAELEESTEAEKKYRSDLQEGNGWCPHFIERLYWTTN